MTAITDETIAGCLLPIGNALGSATGNIKQMPDTLELQGKVVIVTGGTKGVGQGIAERFLQAGCKVIVCARNSPDQLPKVAGRAALFRAADVRDSEQAQQLIDFSIDQFQRLDILVNNAGGAPYADAASASPRFSEAIIRLNLLAPLYLSQAANQVMQRQDSGGCIINIASISGVRPSPGTAAYGAAKAGLLSLTTSLAIEWAPKVRVNAITAGLIMTEKSHLHYGDQLATEAVAATIPLQRLGTPNDIGDTCLYLASGLAGYVSGASILVHGGGETPAFQTATRDQ